MGGRFKAITAYSLRLKRETQRGDATKRGGEIICSRVYLQYGNCLDLFLQLPHPLQRRGHLLSDVLETRTRAQIQYSFVQCEVDKLDFAVLVAPTCSAPVLRFEFPLPTLALSKSPAACSLCPLFCTGVAVFVPSKQFFFIYFQSLFLSLFLISEFYQFRGNNNFAIDG